MTESVHDTRLAVDKLSLVRASSFCICNHVAKHPCQLVRSNLEEKKLFEEKKDPCLTKLHVLGKYRDESRLVTGKLGQVVLVSRVGNLITTVGRSGISIALRLFPCLLIGARAREEHIARYTRLLLSSSHSRRRQGRSGRGYRSDMSGLVSIVSAMIGTVSSMVAVLRVAVSLGTLLSTVMVLRQGCGRNRVGNDGAKRWEDDLMLCHRRHAGGRQRVQVPTSHDNLLIKLGIAVFKSPVHRLNCRRDSGAIGHKGGNSTINCGNPLGPFIDIDTEIKFEGPRANNSSRLISRSSR